MVAAKAERPGGGVMSVSGSRASTGTQTGDAFGTRWGRARCSRRTERSRVSEWPERGVGRQTVARRGLGVVMGAVSVAFLNFDVAHGLA